jgi:hypothetical protein
VEQITGNIDEDPLEATQLSGRFFLQIIIKGCDMRLATTGILIAAAMTLAGSVANSEEDKRAATPLSVYDSGNKLIGTYYRSNPPGPGTGPANWEFAVITSSGLSFYAPVTTLGFQTNGVIVYTTADCSGPAYVELGEYAEYPTSTEQPSPPFVATAAVIGNTAYVPGGAVSTIVFLAVTDLEGVCQQTTGSTLAQKVVKTENLSSFVPPFSVH